MAYAYAKNITELKKMMAKDGIMVENAGKQHPRFDIDGKHRFFFRARKKGGKKE